MEREQRDWHRLFGLILMDFFTNSPFRVELEKDLSLTSFLHHGKESHICG